MKRFLPLVFLSAVAAAPATDPYLWLEDIEGPRALDQVKAWNAETDALLTTDPRYEADRARAKAILDDEAQIAGPDAVIGDRVLNLWRDAKNPRGLWRASPLDAYVAGKPQWTTLIDVDALGKKEGQSWVWHGARCLEPTYTRCLVSLSPGGTDADTVREFDLTTRDFVRGGFALPAAQQSAAWVDADTLLVARDWGTGTMTTSGYPFVVKKLKRGQSLAQAQELYRGKPEDQLGTYGAVLADGSGNRQVVVMRRPTFFGGETLAEVDGKLVKLDVPARVFPTGMVDGQVVFSTSEAWGKVPAGAIAVAPLAEVRKGRFTPEVLFAPGPRQSVDGVSVTKSHVIASVYDNVRARALVFSRSGGKWRQRALPLPDNASIDVASATEAADDAYLAVTGFLAPTTLWRVDTAGDAAPTRVKAMPARFDAGNSVVEQFEAVSSDGTKVPYFIVHRRDVPLDGSTPTIMTAYGGFEASMTPVYSGVTGKLWLERGNSFVLANIRGGGEFGPAWHDAGRKTNRQVIYDDFAAVAKDLIARRLTSPAKLGIYGGSNGGLLMGVAFNQHPDLFKAVTIQVPLLDMIRYEHIAAGASWVDEYGSVSVPEERAFLERISPYRNVRKGVAYPEPYIWTTTKDDRVGPQHARKFAARLKEYGLPYLFYEDTAGGHSGDADIEQGARLAALQMIYFAQKLEGAAPK